MRKGLLAIRNFDAVTGTITVDAQGDAIKSAAILKVVRGPDRFLKKYVATVDPY